MAVHLVVLPLEGHGRTGQQPPHDGRRLGESFDSDRRRVEPDAGFVVLGLHVSRAETELEPRVRQQTERRRLAGDDDGVAEIVVQHERADAQMLRRAECDAGCRERRQRTVHEVIGDVQCVEPDGLGTTGGGDPLLRVAGERTRDPEPDRAQRHEA